MLAPVTTLRRIRTFGSQGQQMLTFHHQAGSYGLFAPRDHPMFILLAGTQIVVG
jgi:hypothetical protein